MSDYYCTISVQNSTIDKVEEIVFEHFEKKTLDICIEVEDRREMYSYTSNFMIEKGLSEQDSVLNNIKLDDFTIDVDLYCSGKGFGMMMLDFLADSMGSIISKKLNTKTLVTLTNQEVPFCIFNCGEREEVFLSKIKITFN
jgi:hypothetical protein